MLIALAVLRRSVKRVGLDPFIFFLILKFKFIDFEKMKFKLIDLKTTKFKFMKNLRADSNSIQLTSHQCRHSSATSTDSVLGQPDYHNYAFKTKNIFKYCRFSE